MVNADTPLGAYTRLVDALREAMGAASDAGAAWAEDDIAALVIKAERAAAAEAAGGVQPATDVTVDLGNLSGSEGNAVVVIGRVRRALQAAGETELAERFVAEARSGDYDYDGLLDRLIPAYVRPVYLGR